MKLLQCELKDFNEKIKDKKIVCFGASEMPKEICEEYPEYCFEEKIAYFIDNDERKQKNGFVLNGKQYRVVSPVFFAENHESDMLLVVTSKYYVQIWEQLNQYEKLKETEGVIWPMVAPQYKPDLVLADKINQLSKPEYKIPKIIHYFWFGGKPMPELEARCLESWKRYCSDYEIKRWDESNYDVNKNPYMKQAYDAKKWGFVPDYARLDVIYQYGGIYLDTDVEVLKTFDELLELPGFAGFESKKYVAMGLAFGACKGNRMIQRLMEDYEKKEFVSVDGKMDLTPSPVFQTEVLKRYGLALNNELQQIDDLVVLPAECFSPDNNMIPHITPNTFSIHHFSGSWTTGDNKAFLEQQRKFINKGDTD